jgi:predicted metal-binding membrane protein
VSSAPPEPAAPALERLLRRHGAITLAALALLWALTWLYVAGGAGLGMSAWDMTRAALWPHQHGQSRMGAMSAWDMRGSTLMLAMWWTMMIAMMAPAATPTVLLYARVQRHAQRRAHTGAFVSGYFLAWLACSLVATALQFALESADLLSAATMGVQVRWLSAAVLVGAGLYQLSPWKNACLSHCRAPAAFLSRHYRPGAGGALRLGLHHGAFCLGCCAALMALLFVGGVMNLAWIAALSGLVLAEKLLPAGRAIGIAAGLVLIGWGVAMLLVG